MDADVREGQARARVRGIDPGLDAADGAHADTDGVARVEEDRGERAAPRVSPDVGVPAFLWCAMI